jgi:ribonuclease P protein component
LSTHITQRNYIYAKANISTKKEEARDHPWVFDTRSYKKGNKSAQGTPQEGTLKTERVSRISMLSRKNRLSRKEFSRFFSVGRRIQSKSFQLVYERHDSFHASVVVSKKIAAHAVDRNKIRRRMYDIVRHCKNDEVRGVFIFIVKQGAVTATHASLKEEIQSKILEAIHQ